MKPLEPFNAVIQVCPKCGKVDVYKDDGHDCFISEDDFDSRDR